MNINFQLGGSPIQARQTLPFFAIIIIAVLIVAVLFLIWIISKKFHEYKTSDKFINKEKNRITKHIDVLKYGANNNLSPEDISLLWEVFSITKSKNINYYFTNQNDVIELFRKAYHEFSKINISDDDLYELFQLEYKIELLMAKRTGIHSTQAIPLGAVILFLSDEGEQLPFFTIKNTPDAFYLELPEHIYKSPRRPKNYIRQRFIYKTNDGTSYNFVTRIIRYEESHDQKFIMVVSHTDKLESTSQRHFKREFVDSTCTISPMRLNTTKKENKDIYIYSTHKYKCKVTNISAGGCCIQTNLPIKENQHLCINLVEMNIEENIIGIIKRTRRLPSGNFALHIQFLNISISTKNEILKRIYKYEL